MKRKLAGGFVVLAFAGMTVGMLTWAGDAKLPKCAAVKCRDIGCPADVLCVSGSKVITCAAACNGN